MVIVQGGTMKKSYLIYLIILTTWLTGCTALSNEPSTDTASTIISEDTSSDHVSIANPFFFSDDALTPRYNASIMFQDIVKKEVPLHIKKVASYENGCLYAFTLDTIEGVPEERLDLGYYYVLDNIIYKVDLTDEELATLKTSDIQRITDNNTIVICQEEAIPDPLTEDEKGFHYSLTVDGDRREFHSYHNDVESGYYESYTWEKDKGLVHYRSGYGAERDAIELQLIMD